METLVKGTFAKKIKSFFRTETGLTVHQMISKMKKEREKDDMYFTVSNVRLFYTDNPNYAGGVNNGYGRGWYITNKSCNVMGSYIKIKSTF
ncbi:MAG: hypothetical protein K9I82_01420 [Chitinophagaceae bacterium]|nr:hypothetical protein [Chitinophagaceae bacterium]